MDLSSILALSFVCAMGAMSPGPSLAVVLRNTISGGRLQGIMTGIGHGIGFGLYALVAVTGLSALLLAHESIFLFLLVNNNEKWQKKQQNMFSFAYFSQPLKILKYNAI